MPEFDPSELLKLAALLSVRAEESDAKANVHDAQNEHAQALYERKRADGGRHFSAVCNYFHEKLTRKRTRNPAKTAEEREGALANFSRFWDAYPKRRAKGDALKAWDAMRCEPKADVILAAVKRAAQSPDWKKDGGQFIPYPATWLRREGWEDDICRPAAERRSANVQDENPPGWAVFLKERNLNLVPHKFAEEYLRDDFILWRRAKK